MTKSITCHHDVQALSIDEPAQIEVLPELVIEPALTSQGWDVVFEYMT